MIIDILEKSDQWIEMFKKVHDIFRALTLTEKYRKQNIIMELSCGSFFSRTNNNIKERNIYLDMKQYGAIVQKGMTISIDEENDDIYKYLVANVIAYYLSQNYADAQIDLMDFNWTLYSNDKVPHDSTVPMLAGLGTLHEDNDYAKLVTSLIGCHNVGVPTEQIIANLRNRIANQPFPNRLESGINHSSRQYDYLSQMEQSDINVQNEKKGKVLQKICTDPFEDDDYDTLPF